MEPTKKKLSLRKEEIASFDEQKNAKGGTGTTYVESYAGTGCWESNGCGGGTLTIRETDFCVESMPPSPCVFTNPPACVIAESFACPRISQEMLCQTGVRCYVMYTDGC